MTVHGPRELTDRTPTVCFSVTGRDPDAVAAARMNARSNGCHDRIEVRMDGPESLRDVPPRELVVEDVSLPIKGMAGSALRNVLYCGDK